MLKKFLLILFIAISIKVDSQICDFKYRKRITIDPAKVAGSNDLTNFPVLIKIASDNDLRTLVNSGYVENSSGFDIIFTSDDGITPLNFQFEKYTASNGEYTAWVKVPVLSTTMNTYIYMYYGNSTITTNQSSSTTWSDYHGVWHLQNNSFIDNSANAYTLTNNATTNQSPAYINDGRALSGTNQWLESATFPNLTTNFTISGWINTADNIKQGQRMFCDDANNTTGFAVSIGDPGIGSLRFYSRSTNPVSLDLPLNTILNDTWYYIAAVADITAKRKTIYINGVSVATAAYTNAWGSDVGNSSIGGEPAGSSETANRLNGKLDEIRVANAALSADWILTEYNNQNSPSTFYSISAHPNVWLGGTNAWNTGSNWSDGSKPGATDDVVIPNTTNQPIVNGNPQILSLFVKPSASISLSNKTLSIRFDVVNCGAITSGTNGELILNSNAIQNQYLSGTGTYNLNDLTISNTFATSPAIILNKDINVAENLTLTSGIVYSNSTNILALGNTATSTSGSATSFVSGPMTKSGTANFNFPVGKGTKWRRAAIKDITANTTFRAEYFNTPYVSVSPINLPLVGISTIEYWQVDRIVGSGNAKLGLFWENASASGINNCPDLTIARWSGTGWDERAAAAVGSCAAAGTGSVVTSAALTAFSPFTFGSKSSVVNPLPIELVKFEAQKNGSDVDVTWVTASESNNDYFTIEKTSDFLAFETVQIIPGAGNSVQTKNYKIVDDYPYNGLSYYRLKQTDYNGTYKYSQFASVEFNNNDFSFNVFPNPNDGNSFNLFINSSHKVSIQLYDVNGKEVYFKSSDDAKGNSNNYTIIPNNTLSKGIYFIIVKSEDEIFTKKIIVE